MEWKATYSDGSEYTSQAYKWNELPALGTIKVFLIFPSGNQVTINGWDYYALKVTPTAIQAFYWKDTFSNDIKGDPLAEPMLDKGATRSFWDDETSTHIEYKDADTIKTEGEIPADFIKKGEWINDTLAKEMGVL